MSGHAAFFQSTTKYQVAPARISLVTTPEDPSGVTINFSTQFNLDDNITPDVTDFVITGVTGNPIKTTVTIDAVNKKVRIGLAGLIGSLDTPLVTYTPGASPIQDVLGNQAAGFINQPVTNLIAIPPTLAGNALLTWLLRLPVDADGVTLPDSTGNGNAGQLAQSNCIQSDGSALITYAAGVLTGRTVASNLGTGTAAVSGNTITITAGSCYKIILDNGDLITLAEGAGATVESRTNGISGTLSGGYTWVRQDAYHANWILGFSNLGFFNANYVSLTTTLNFATKFELQFSFIPNNIATLNKIFGSANSRLEIGNGVGTIRMGAGTVSAITFTPAAVGYSSNAKSLLRLVRDFIGNIELYLNGNLIHSYNDTTSASWSMIGRATTAAGGNFLLDYVKVIDSDVDSHIGQTYTAENDFQGTAQGGFFSVKYQRIKGGDANHRNLAGVWHNGCETLVKPNPSGNAAIQAATGWTNATTLSYSQLTTLSDPAFCNVTRTDKYQDLVSYTSNCAYEDELKVNAFVGKTSINVNVLSGFSSANRYELAHADAHEINDTAFTVWVWLRPSETFVSSLPTELYIGKTDKTDATMVGWGVAAFAGEVALRARNGANVLVTSRKIAFSEKEGSASSLICFIVDAGKIKSSINGFVEPTLVDFVGSTPAGSGQTLKLGALPTGSGSTSGIVSWGYCANKALSDNEVEALYQQGKINRYHKPDGCTRMFVSEDGNANLTDRVSGSVQAVKSGTITVTSTLQANNVRYRYEDYQNDDYAYAQANGFTALTNSSVAMRLIVVGDSRLDPDVYSAKFWEHLDGLIRADADLNNLQYNGFFADTVAGTINIRHHAINGATSSTMRSGGGGNIGTHMAMASPDGGPTIILIGPFGTNGTNTDTNLNTEINEYPTLMQIIRSNSPSPSTLRIGVLSELEHSDPFRCARIRYLANYHREKAWPKMIAQGYKILRREIYKKVTIQAGHFMTEVDGFTMVHQNDAGNIAKAEEHYRLLRLLCGLTEEP